MKDHHNRTYEAKRIWPTPAQIKQLAAMGYPKEATDDMNYREADNAIAVGTDLNPIVIEWEKRFSLPEMKAVSGTQLVFARSCRHAYLKHVAAVYAGLGKDQQAQFMKTLERLKAVVDAKYWIEKRNESLERDFSNYCKSVAPRSNCSSFIS